MQLDVTDGESRSDFLKQATAFGPCQVLVNNAGVLKQTGVCSSTLCVIFFGV